ncbi:Rha family transcriptional regulator [Aquipseudomonas alcaligenes]|uniref:Phage regulatory protein Rha (Phage_pRha) n=1 Tax=Aquipseudomonas alcaligenes TaxID=43263 RepID=A0A1N6RNC9_AQUAC|nr:Rha family transcriptional regulator [Pseudomonas alcaligenes]SIQ30408.1 Phage regulatory protein Rha (Phage_pRha) [Pseudomonas alcaligenes]
MDIKLITLESIAKAGMVTPTTLNGFPGMSSLEITEITGKGHKNVLRDIAKMVAALESHGSDLSRQIVRTQYRDSRGKFQPLTVIDKELTFTLLSRYSYELSNLIVKRWLELEGSEFARVPVQASVAHLVEREKDIFRNAMKELRRGPQSQTPAAKALRRHKAADARIATHVRRNVYKEGS